MTNLDENKKDWSGNAAWWSVTGIAAAIFLFSLFEAFTFTLSKAAILGVSVFVAILIAQYHFKIPRTESVFYPKTVFAFWGTAWLGLFGGVLLAAAASAADYGHIRKDPEKWIRGVAADIISAFVSSTVFHLSLGYFSGPQATVVGGSFFIPNEVIYASCLMAVAHYATSSAINLLSIKVDGNPINSKALDRVFIDPSTGHAVSLAAAIFLFLVFNHFGIEFGLVIVPLAIAANVAYKIHVRSLGQKTKEIMEASRIHLATVEALATAIDARDQIGMGHVRRTQIYAVGLGKLMDLPNGDIDALRTAALLHDIGKLAIPDHILNKPGRLTPAETEKTKTHSLVGASILEKVGFLTPVVPTVKYHHEYWDGTGYPEGLRGNQIPATAMILAIADSYDTLRGARPYRPAISHEDACDLLCSGAGKQFDPKIVDLFLRNLRTFEQEIQAEGLTYQLEPESVALDGRSPNFVEQIKRANREVFTLYSLARDFGAALNLQETLTLFADKVGEFVPYDCCAIFLLDETGEFATAAHVAGPSSDFLNGKRVKIGEGATGYVLKKQRPVENVDPAMDFAFSLAESSQSFKTMVSRPLVADDKLIGAISLYSSELEQFQDEHFRLLETVSRIAADAIAKSKQHAETASHALTDPITGLPNARSLQVEFDKEVKRSIRADSTFQVLMLDLDRFKAVNDTFGHKVGDNFLTAIGGVIRSQLRDYDFLARYAGDEFVALIPETDQAGIKELCSRIESAVNDFRIEIAPDEAARVGVSIGSARYPSQGESFDQLIISADKAMYLTKAKHKQTGKRFDPSMEYVSGEMLAVDVDETQIISTASIN